MKLEILAPNNSSIILLLISLSFDPIKVHIEKERKVTYTLKVTYTDVLVTEDLSKGAKAYKTGGNIYTKENIFKSLWNSSRGF